MWSVHLLMCSPNKSCPKSRAESFGQSPRPFLLASLSCLSVCKEGRSPARVVLSLRKHVRQVWGPLRDEVKLRCVERHEATGCRWHRMATCAIYAAELRPEDFGNRGRTIARSYLLYTCSSEGEHLLMSSVGTSIAAATHAKDQECDSTPLPSSCNRKSAT